MSILTVLPQDYAFVVAALPLSYVGLLSLGSGVMKARKECGVPYPAAYASVVVVDGNKCTDAKSVDLAEKFNGVQRGHQNGLENHYAVMVMTAVAGLGLPRVAAASLLLWTFGAVTYGKQYASGGPSKRNKGAAITKYVGLLGLLVSSFATSYLIFTAK